MERRGRLDIGTLVIGLIIIGVGVYYVFDKTLGFSMPELDWDKIWPLAVIAAGLGILWSAYARMHRGGSGPQGV